MKPILTLVAPSHHAIAHDSARATRTLESLSASGFTPHAGSLVLLTAAFANSPYLCRLALREPAILGDLFTHGPQSILDSAIAAALTITTAPDEPTAMSALRAAKRRTALAIALADIAGAFDLGQVTTALTNFADAAVKGSLRYLLREAARTSHLTVPNSPSLAHTDPATLESTTGLVVLAMGKYGAYELNYSSDIDLVVFYDAERFPFRKRDDARGAAVDIVRGLVRLMSEITADGYVFRVDLRLRPDAGATQIAISTAAAESYYEGMGQNWERAAMIKARACAGDPQTGIQFLKALEPFVWRRNLDYAAIEDIHSIKRQIHAHGGHGAVAVAGHNIKLGRGGIREIEFFAQTQQLILGGRNPKLRPRGTLEAITALTERGLVAPEAKVELEHAYIYLRTLEHRLQMIDDQQTHTLPKSPGELLHVANFMGYADVETFGAALTKELKTVEGHYARLFERAPDLGAASGNLVFTGVEDDPETSKTLAHMGYRDTHHVAAAIRGWHHGRIRATRSARAREILTRLMPALLADLAQTADPDAAFAQFDRFVTNLPAGVQVFSLFLARRDFLKLIAEVCGSAPRLAAHLGRHPATLDVMMDPDFLSARPGRAELDQALKTQLGASSDYEEALDAARRFAREHAFRVGVQVIEGRVKADEAGPAFADIAESVVAGLLPVVEEELSEGAGRVAGGQFVVIAMGKLGGREMTAGSDLDLIFVYDAPQSVEHTGGPKPVPLIVYYARLAQRFISALTAPTAAGVLYEVDMRLRPTGNKGPVAVSLESFARYHTTESWTWERMALTRARVIAGDEALARKVEAEIARTLRTRTSDAKLIADAREMREKLFAQFPGKSRWDIKYTQGGLIDLEFLAQTLQLRHAYEKPEILSPNTAAALRALALADILSTKDAGALLEATATEHALTQILRIAQDGTLDPDTATPGLKKLITRAAGAKDFKQVDKQLTRLEANVRKIFDRVMRE